MRPITLIAQISVSLKESQTLIREMQVDWDIAIGPQDFAITQALQYTKNGVKILSLAQISNGLGLKGNDRRIIL